MQKKTILGLDLGTNSIGWAIVQKDTKVERGKTVDLNAGEIFGLGSRIIPMSQDILGKFDAGATIETQTASRTKYRGSRRLHERNLLRRERLQRVLNLLGFLPKHFAEKLDNYGKFQDGIEIKLPYSQFNETSKKWDFIFKKSYLEMVDDFRKNQPQLFFSKKNGEESKIPYDWTIYYLRKKALSQKIEKDELAWVLLHFNQKRGYYQLRGEDEVKNENKLEEFYNLKIIDVVETGKGKNDGEIWYNVILENGWIYRRSSRIPLYDWINKNRDFIVTTELNADRSIKVDNDGNEKRSFRAPKDDDWNLLKKKTESDIKVSKKYVAEFIYDTLLQQPNQKIKGKLVRTIERNFYREELKQIIATQVNFHSELQDRNYYKKCCDALYENNEMYKKSIANKDFNFLIVDDILFYQRPLKSKKSEISDCSLEFRKYKLNGEEKIQAIKCIAKSHPLFQEFRLWQWIRDVRIFERNQAADIPVTDQFLSDEKAYEKLFEFLNERKEIDQNGFLKYILEPQKLKGKALNEMVAKYRWNYIDDNEKTYPCNETHNNFKNRLNKVDNVPESFFTQENEIKLWHILYSVRDKHDIIKALKSFIIKYNETNNTQINHVQFVENFQKYPLIKSEYGSYSEKAIKKLLPLMRLGKYWNETDVINNIATYQNNIEAVFANINKRENTNSKVKDELLQLDGTLDLYKGLRKEIATYLVYQIHSESSDKTKWEKPGDIDLFLKDFKQHSLRNPIVEQVITETLRVVKDIWVKYGGGKKDFFNEIHIELGREMKNNAADRKAITEMNLRNENTNLRIRAILAEFQNIGVEKVMPHSPYQLDAFKIFEDGIIKSYSETDLKNEKLDGLDISILEMSKKSNPTAQEILKYKLWLEQKYRSPYTGEIIPLSKLFTSAYEIEHIIPKSIYFDDSFSNKVICESVVNKRPYKDNQFGLEFIKNQGSTIVTELSTKDKTVTIHTEEQYRKFIETHYSNNKAKAKKLLLVEVPEKMIERQLNDTRYISKIVKNMLSKMVREDKDDDGVTSKNVISTNGTITSILKQDWGLNDVWNDLMFPRFERLNELTKTNHFTYYNEKHQKLLPTVPDELRKGFQLKRIDHRHHAMDALVIACTTRSHINYLNNQTALDKGKNKNEKQISREDLKRKLCFKTKPDANGNYNWQFYKPWDTFTQDAKGNLEKVIISFKQNLRVINKTVNKYYSYKDESGNLRLDKNGSPKKELIKQTKGDNWAVRKPLHTPMPYARKEYQFDILKIDENVGKKELIIDDRIRLQIIDLLAENGNSIGKVQAILKKYPLLDENKLEIIETAFGVKNIKYRKRKSINDLANRSAKGGITTIKQMLKILNKVVDFKLRKDLLNHLNDNQSDIDIAFSLEGIDKFNEKRKVPVYKLPIAESSSSKFKLGDSIGTNHKYAEAETGTNLYFAVYQDKNGKRRYDTIALNIVIERLKQKLSPVPEKENCRLLFWLSPNDLVYIPTDDEKESLSVIDFKNLSKDQLNRVYKFVDGGGTTANFVSQFVSSLIFEYTKKDQQKMKINYCIQNEFGIGSPQSKNQKSNDGIMIKEHCIKLKVDRLGNIIGYQG
jgi:CRISPR-associated endonuclease Csn1